MTSLKDKVILVTGGASGIGQAAAKLFASEGAAVIIADMSEENGLATCRDIESGGGRCHFVRTNVTIEAEVSNLVDAALDKFGKLDGAFNNAGVEQSWRRLHEMDEAQWRRVLDINLTGIFLCMKYEIAAMLPNKAGSIVNTSSSLGQAAVPYATDYTASKHGVLGLSRAAACDYAKDGIRVNALMPGLTRTPMGDRVPEIPELHQMFGHFLNVLPMGRLAEPKEIAQGAAWLLSDAASFVTGIGLPVDGGYLTV